MKRTAIIHRVPIREKDFRPVNDEYLGVRGYTINMEGEVRDKTGHPLHRVYLPHLPGAIISIDRAVILVNGLVKATFYPNAD